MKKLILASIVASAATVASAQVTIYGMVDTAVQSYNNGTARFSRSADNLWSTSRLGFRGTEDIGSGLKANFQLEAQVNPAAGSVGSTTVATNEMFNREAWVGLSGGFGEFRIGRTDMTLAGEMDILTTQAGNFALMPTNGTTVELGTDQKNVFKYISPSFKGLQLQLSHGSNAVGSTTDAGTTQDSASLSYTQGKLKIAVAHHRVDGSGVAKKDATSAGIAYDFGPVSIGAAHVQGDNSTTADVKSSASIVSAKVPFAHGFAGHVAVGQTTAGAVSTNNKGVGYTVALTKEFSKRTLVYGAYTNVNNQSGSSMSMTGVTAPTVAGLDTSAVSFGINHRF